MALNATLGSSTANSYVDVATADAYAANVWWGATWLALATADKEIALIGATGGLEAVKWKGTRCSPSSDDADKPQALSWPRSDAECDGVPATCSLIPPSIITATCELAYQLSTNPGALQPGPPTSGASGTFVSKEKLGDLEVNYQAYPSGATTEDCSSCSDPKVISLFPWLKGYLSCWTDAGSGGSSRVILRVRS